MSVERLRAIRDKRHRLEPPRPLRTVRGAIAFVERSGIVLQSGRSSLPTLTEAIVGRAIRGSWLADPEVHRIYEIWTGVAEAGAFVATRAILGKQAYCTAELGPALSRIGCDNDVRATAMAELTPPALKLLRDVEHQGEVRFDTWDGTARNVARRARDDLVKRMLIDTIERHTAAGHHVSLLVPWPESDTASRFKAAARKVTTQTAQDAIVEAAIAAAVLAPAKEVASWTRWSAATLERLLDRGKAARVPDAPGYVSRPPAKT